MKKQREDGRNEAQEGSRRGSGRLRYAGVSTLILAMLMAALIAVNIGVTAWEKKQGWRVDWSFNSLTTHSAATKELLAQLDKPVHIYALYRRGAEDAPLMELLDRYAAATPMITWERTDPSLNPQLLSRYATESTTVTEDSLIVTCEETGRWRVLGAEDFVSVSLDTETGEYTSAGWTYERGISRAIQYVSRDRIPRVVIAQGHGELDQETAAAFAELLTGNQYETVFADFTAESELPEAGDLMVFLSPLRDLTEGEMERLRTFAEQGGSFLFACDYTDPLNRMERYTSLMRSYGIVPREGIVCANPAETGSYYQGSRIQLIPEMCPTDMTLDLLAAGMDTLLLPGCRGFETPEEGDRNLITAEVLKSGEGSYLKQITAGTTSMERGSDDPEGPFTLAVQARRVTGGGYVSRAVAVGCSALLTESGIWAMTDSQQLIIRMMEFLLDTEASDLNIMEKNAMRPALSPGSIGLGSILICALPVATLMAALAVLLPRRRR